MAKAKKMRVFGPPKQAKPKVPEAVKAHVTVKANDLIDTVLKPAHIKPPAGDERFNYIVDLYSRWYRNYLYFCSRYACPGLNAISPYFEEKFARLEYAGYDRFHLAYMRHTGNWCEIYIDLSLDECLAAIRDEPHFLP
jgi:hypothetical protein